MHEAMNVLGKRKKKKIKVKDKTRRRNNII